MDSHFAPEFIDSARKQFAYYKSLADKTFVQLNDEQLFWQYTEESNSIGIIVKHMSGNMLSRWTDFLITDGEKAWRDRDAEFDNNLQHRDELLKQWDAGWQCLFNALDSLTTENFFTVIYIRNQGHTVMEAITRQLAHYTYHVGQIIFIGKMISGSAWKPLSIAKGDSSNYNGDKFAKEKRIQHFTDEYLNDEKDTHEK